LNKSVLTAKKHTDLVIWLMTQQATWSQWTPRSSPCLRGTRHGST